MSPTLGGDIFGMHCVEVAVQSGFFVATPDGPGKDRRLSCAVFAAYTQHSLLVHLAGPEQGSFADSQPEATIVHTG